MLHYSNASSIERNRRYLVIKGGGLAWLLGQGGVVNTVVDHRGYRQWPRGLPEKVTEGEHNK